MKGTNGSPSPLASDRDSSTLDSRAGQNAALAKNSSPYRLVVLGQPHGLAVYMQRPQYALSSSPQYLTQDYYVLRLFQPFLPIFAITVSLLHPQLTVGTTCSGNHVLYATLHSRACHVGHQFSDHNFFYYLCLCFLSQQIERTPCTCAVNLTELAACHCTFWVNVTHKKNLKKALFRLRSG